MKVTTIINRKFEQQCRNCWSLIEFSMEDVSNRDTWLGPHDITCPTCGTKRSINTNLNREMFQYERGYKEIVINIDKTCLYINLNWRDITQLNAIYNEKRNWFYDYLKINIMKEKVRKQFGLWHKGKYTLRIKDDKFISVYDEAIKELSIEKGEPT